jgi:hypothetical protein
MEDISSDKLLKGQDEIKDLINNMKTLMIENFTYLSKDINALDISVNSDIELLFKEVTELKRKVNKLERKFHENIHD